jgi:hypothetical protein
MRSDRMLENGDIFWGYGDLRQAKMLALSNTLNLKFKLYQFQSDLGIFISAVPPDSIHHGVNRSQERWNESDYGQPFAIRQQFAIRGRGLVRSSHSHA